jgi:hypothetical protein
MHAFDAAPPSTPGERLAYRTRWPISKRRPRAASGRIANEVAIARPIYFVCYYPGCTG